MRSVQESNVLEYGLLTPNEILEVLSLLRTPSSPNSSSEVSNIIDERKQRRMISNRASARRSRLRKKIHLEKLMEQLNQLRVQNRELKTELSLILNGCQVAWRVNEQLRYEDLMLRARLSDLCRILVAMQQQ